MSTFLYRLGRAAFRRRWLVLALWLGSLVAITVASVSLSKETSSDFVIPGTESQQTNDMLKEEFPEAAVDGATATVVFAVDDAEQLADSANQSTVEEVLSELSAVPGVASVSDPFTDGTVSESGSIAYTEVEFDQEPQDLPAEAGERILAAMETGRSAGLTVEAGGDALEADAEPGSEIIGLGVAALVLMITFGSLLAAGLPLLNAVIGVFTSVSLISASSYFFDLSSDASTLALMLGLAVAVDYALFILSRYRNEIAVGHPREEAIGRAVGTGGSAVVFAGLTVIIALAGLAVVDIPILTQMGLAAAATVAISVVIALTLLPAMAGIVGRRVVGRGIPGLRGSDPKTRNGKPTMGWRWVTTVTRKPLAVLLVAVTGLGVLALPAASMELELPDDGRSAPDTTQRKAYDLLSEGFGPGFNGPLLVVVDATDSADPDAAANEAATTIADLDGVASVSEPAPNETGDTLVFNVVPDSAPTSTETADLVDDIRQRADGLRDTTGAAVTVSGLTAMSTDVTDRLGDALVPYLLVIVGLALVLLLLAFRSVVVPIKAAGGFLLSMFAGLGATVALFQWGWLSDLIGLEESAPIVAIMPIIMVGITFGLAMDYQIFLVTRMREEHVHGAAPTQAVVDGFSHGARVVTAAAVIMISVFAGFVIGDDALIKQLGFGLAAVIFLDAFVVRMTIVPAVMTLLGRRIWWLPAWLGRVLPNVDVEGEGLRKRLDATAEPQPELTRT